MPKETLLNQIDSKVSPGIIRSGIYWCG